MGTLEIITGLSLASFALLTGVFVRRLMTSAGPIDAELKKLPEPLQITRLSAPQTKTGKADHWLSHSLRAAGTTTPASVIILLAVCLAILTAAAASIYGLPLAAQVILTVFAFLLVPLVITILKRRRIKKISEQMPATLDLIARAVRAGESFENAISIAARSSKAPISQELAYCVKQFEMGTATGIVMGDFAKRIGTIESRIFAHTVSVHRELGGRLANGLERLAKVIRDRREYIQKVNSLTSLGRYSIAAISMMGLFVLAYLLIFQPEYLSRLLDSELGLKMVGYALLSEIVGLGWIALTLKTEH